MTRKLTNDQLETMQNLLSSTLSNREIALNANCSEYFIRTRRKNFTNKNSGGRPKALSLREKQFNTGL